MRKGTPPLSSNSNINSNNSKTPSFQSPHRSVTPTRSSSRTGSVTPPNTLSRAPDVVSTCRPIPSRSKVITIPSSTTRPNRTLSPTPQQKSISSPSIVTIQTSSWTPVSRNINTLTTTSLDDPVAPSPVDALTSSEIRFPKSNITSKGLSTTSIPNRPNNDQKPGTPSQYHRPEGCLRVLSSDTLCLLEVDTVIWSGEKSGDLTVRSKSGEILKTIHLNFGVVAIPSAMTKVTLQCGTYRVWVGWSNGLITIYDALSGEPCGPNLQWHFESISSIHHHESHVYAASLDGKISQITMATMELVRMMTGHTLAVRCITSHGRHLYSGSDDRTLIKWDLIDISSVRRLPQASASPILSLQVNGLHLWSGCEDGRVKVCDTETGVELANLAGHSGSVICMQKAGNQMWSAGNDQHICIWHLMNFQLLRRMQAHEGKVLSMIKVVARPEQFEIWTSATDKSVRSWRDMDYVVPCPACTDAFYRIQTMAKELSSQVEYLKSNEEHQQKTIAQLQTTKDELLKQQSAVAGMNGNIQQLYKEMSERYDKEVVYRQNAQKELQTLAESLASVRKDRDLVVQQSLELQSCNEKLTFQIDELRAQLEDVTNYHETPNRGNIDSDGSLQTRLHKAETIVGQLQLALSDETGRSEMAQLHNIELQREKEQLKSENNKHLVNLKKYEEQIRDLEKEIFALKNNNQHSISNIQDTESRIKILQLQINQQEARCKEKDETIMKQEEEIVKLKVQLTSYIKPKVGHETKPKEIDKSVTGRRRSLDLILDLASGGTPNTYSPPPTPPQVARPLLPPTRYSVATSTSPPNSPPNTTQETIQLEAALQALREQLDILAIRNSELEVQCSTLEKKLNLKEESCLNLRTKLSEAQTKIIDLIMRRVGPENNLNPEVLLYQNQKLEGDILLLQEEKEQCSDLREKMKKEIIALKEEIKSLKEIKYTERLEFSPFTPKPKTNNNNSIEETPVHSSVERLESVLSTAHQRVETLTQQLKSTEMALKAKHEELEAYRKEAAQTLKHQDQMAVQKLREQAAEIERLKFKLNQITTSNTNTSESSSNEFQMTENTTGKVDSETDNKQSFHIIRDLNKQLAARESCIVNLMDALRLANTKYRKVLELIEQKPTM